MEKSAFIKQADILKSLAALIGPTIGVGMAQDAYSKKFVSQPDNSKKGKDIYDRLLAIAKKDGVNIINDEKAPSSYYNMSKNELSMRKDQTRPDILAHEIGHSKHKTLARVGAGYSGLANILALTVPFGKSRVASKIRAGGAMAMYAPTLASEGTASASGYGLMREQGASKKEALGAGVGLPTYLAQAILPLLMYKAKKGMKGFSS